MRLHIFGKNGPIFRSNLGLFLTEYMQTHCRYDFPKAIVHFERGLVLDPGHKKLPGAIPQLNSLVGKFPCTFLISESHVEPAICQDSPEVPDFALILP